MIGLGWLVAFGRIVLLCLAWLALEISRAEPDPQDDDPVPLGEPPESVAAGPVFLTGGPADRDGPAALENWDWEGEWN